MALDDLDIRFEKAVEMAEKMSQSSLPQDVQLRLYAYYKQATHGTKDNSNSSTPNDLRNAFKMNAWMQIRHISIEEAKERYIEIIEQLNQ